MGEARTPACGRRAACERWRPKKRTAISDGHKEDRKIARASGGRSCVAEGSRKIGWTMRREHVWLDCERQRLRPDGSEDHVGVGADNGGHLVWGGWPGCGARGPAAVGAQLH